jgi:multidrug efflux system outer membrane protein
VDPAAWWRAFGDPGLDALIERMHANNTRVGQDVARLAAANARAYAGAASQKPLVAAATSLDHASGPLINKAGDSGTLFAAGLAISWEVDILGRMSGERAAERLDAKAAAAVLDDTRLLMEAATVRRYFEACYAHAAMAEAEREAALWQERKDIAAARVRAGLSPGRDADTVRQRAISSASDAADLRYGYDAARNALAFLVGDDGSPALCVKAMAVAPPVPPDLPSALLENRPDVEAALIHMEAASGRLRSAKRSWLPSFGLTTSGGVVAPTIVELLASSARSFGLDLLLALPLFDGGRHEARVASSKAELELAKVQYRQAMLAALQEVNDALSAVQATEQKLRLAGESLALTEKDVVIVAGQSARGTASRGMLVETRLAASAQCRTALAAQFERIAAAIDLAKALGGGWAQSR